MDELVKILLCEGGDVELGARTSKHIFVFTFDSLSLTLSLILCLVLIHIIHSYLYAWYCLYVCHTCVQPREFHIAPQLYLEEFRGDSQEPFTGNSVTLFAYTKCVTINF